MLGWSQTGVDTWIVRAEEPAAMPDQGERTATVTLTVCNRNGQPSPDQADRLRRYLDEHDCLSRNPTVDELSALEHARSWTPATSPRQPPGKSAESQTALPMLSGS